VLDAGFVIVHGPFHQRLPADARHGIVDHVTRPYDSILTQTTGPTSREEAMQRVVDQLWSALHPTGVSWLGFYLHDGGSQLILGPRRDKPACSPIGLHGACGRAFLTKQPLIVRDVRELGPNYIACDPRDRSEVVIPLLESDGRAWGVFDADSHDLASFDETDVDGLTRLLRRAGLTA
jgi:putative methionine-R-sulfoxide reductase with GAF domain